MSEPAQLAVAVLDQVTRLLQVLTPEQVQKLAAGSAHLEFVADGERVAAPPSRTSRPSKVQWATPSEAAQELRNKTTVEDRREYLIAHVRGKELPALAKLLLVDIKGRDRTKATLADLIARAPQATPPSEDLQVPGQLDSAMDEHPTDANPDQRHDGMSGFERLMGGRWQRRRPS